MPPSLQLPVLKELLPSGIPFGAGLLVEFQPDSLWYETSLTLAAYALRDHVGTEYHTFQHFPKEIKQNLTAFGLDMKKLEEADAFRMIDSYTVTTGLESVPGNRKRSGAGQSESLKVSDWSIGLAQTLKGGINPDDMNRFHIDDNTTVLSRYNQENAIIDYWRTRTIPYSRKLNLIYVHSLVKGVHSEAFYRLFESLADGIIDFETRRESSDSGQVEQLMRVRILRGRAFDSKWRKLTLLQSGEVSLTER